MTDRLGKVIRKGDCVKYWHRINGKPVPEVGEVVRFTGGYGKQEVAIERKHYNDTDISFRTASGITKMTKAEAFIWKMEQYTVDGDF